MVVFFHAAFGVRGFCSGRSVKFQVSAILNVSVIPQNHLSAADVPNLLVISGNRESERRRTLVLSPASQRLL